MGTGLVIKSIYEFPRAHLAKTLFGEPTPGALRKIDAWLDGECKMTVDVLYTLASLEPLLDVDRTLKDMYARYEVARFKKKRNPKPFGGKK